MFEEKVRWFKKIFFHNNLLPEQMTIFVTNKCNLRCEHCFYWQNLNKNDEEFSIEELEKVCLTIGKFSFLSLGGGEPFLRDDIPEIVKLFININKVSRISIPTNGFSTEKIVSLTDKILNLADGTEILVKISLDGLDEEHDKIRGVLGSFRKAVDTFTQLKRFKRKYKNFRLGILLTLSKLNEYQLWDTYKYVKNNLQPDIIGLNFIRGMVKADSLKEVSLENYKDLYSHILTDLPGKRGHGFYSTYKFRVSELIDEIVKKRKYPLTCYAGRLSVVIDSSLNVFPCENLDRKIGDLRSYNYNFKNLWYSEDASKIRKYITSNNCYCTSECNLQINSFFNIRELLNLGLKTTGYWLKGWLRPYFLTG